MENLNDLKDCKGCEIAWKDAKIAELEDRLLVNDRFVEDIGYELRGEDNFAIGIVGSRRASLYGLINAEKFSSYLSVQGVTIGAGNAAFLANSNKIIPVRSIIPAFQTGSFNSILIFIQGHL